MHQVSLELMFSLQLGVIGLEQGKCCMARAVSKSLHQVWQLHFSPF
jgi:hypothetical protein